MARARVAKEKSLIDRMLDQVNLKGLTQEEVLGQDGLLKQLTGKLLSKILEAEMADHLGYEKHSSAGDNSGDSRNGTFEPLIIPKYEKRVPLFNDQIISMYSFGMTARDIKAHLKKIYHVEVSPELISHVTEAVMEEVKEWQSRPLEKSYAIRNFVSYVSGRPAGQNPAGWEKLH
jgi:transposase-like protein